MMKYWLFIAALFLAPMAFAQAPEFGQRLAMDLASDQVDITTGFHGGNVEVFGMRQGPGVVAVVVKGPERTMMVRRKTPVLGAWINTQYLKFRRVPSYYDYALSAGKADIPPSLLKDAKIGLDSLYFDPDISRDDPDLVRKFQEALVRNKQAQGIFPTGPKPIEFISDGFFRASFYMPPNLPSGTYEVHAYLIDGGQVIEEKTKTLLVAQVGFNARVNRLAENHGFFYAILGLFMAVGAGWGVHFLRR